MGLCLVFRQVLARVNKTFCDGKFRCGTLFMNCLPFLKVVSHVVVVVELNAQLIGLLIVVLHASAVQ